MSTAATIRRLEPGDLTALLGLCRDHAAYEHAEFHEDGQLERWRSLMFADPAVVHGWVAVDGDVVCGFMTVTIDHATWSARPFAHMDCLFVQEAYRRQGLGRAFLAHLRDFCDLHGCRSAEWQTPVGNRLGIDFYEHMGAKAMPKVRFRANALALGFA